MVQQNEMSARALTMEEMENVNGGIPSLMRQILKRLLQPEYQSSAFRPFLYRV